MSSSRTPDFGAVAEVYDEVRPADAQWREVFELLYREADLGAGRVLDVGCGTGRLLDALAERGVAGTGVDKSPEMLAVARRKLPDTTLAEAGAEELPFPDASFDRVVFHLVVHLVERRRAFAEARRVLGPAGALGIVTFDHAHFGGYYLQEYFPSIRAIDEGRFPDERTLRAELMQAGFVGTRVVPVRQQATAVRDAVLQRVRARHISTLQLLDEDEYAAGLDRLERELPGVVAYTSNFLVVTAEREPARLRPAHGRPRVGPVG
jgi:ubiquinone/menaquinone biosynthesis C-methylase UbiE